MQCCLLDSSTHRVTVLQKLCLVFSATFLCAVLPAQETAQTAAPSEPTAESFDADQGLSKLPKLGEQIDGMAQQLIDDGLAVAMVVGVIQGNEILIRSYGETELGNGQLPDKNTVFEIGSVSKVFTSILLAVAVGRGVVALEDPLQEVIGDRFEVQQFKEQPIQLWHLAAHCSGLPRMPGNFLPKDPASPYADYSFEHLYAFLRVHQLRRAPGKQYEYSNLAVALLGHLQSQKALVPSKATILCSNRLSPPKKYPR